MADNLFPLAIPPGFDRNGTLYQNKGRWADGNLVRFFEGTIQPVGGWRVAPNADQTDQVLTVRGVPRGAVSWRNDNGDRFFATGTTLALAIMVNGVVYDVTPVGFTPGQPNVHSASGNGNYGNAAYGVGSYGVGSTANALLDPDTWQLDTYGNWLVGVSTSDNLLYTWKGDTSILAAGISAGSNRPTSARAVVVTPERFVVALGASGNTRLAQWASQNADPSLDASWFQDSTTSAGQLQLATNGRLVCGRRVRAQTLLFTDTDLHAMTYIGGTYIYRIDQVGDHCGLIAPNAVAVVDGRAYWMGTESFFSYNGFVQSVPSEVGDYVFSGMNRAQRAKVVAVPNAAFGEIWWFYPSASSAENDSYVVYNFRENHWTTGQLQRTAGVDQGATDQPILCDALGTIYEHEILQNRASGTELGPFFADGTYIADGLYRGAGNVGYAQLVPFLASAPIELGDGTQLMSIDRFVPDILAFGDVQLTLYGATEPAAAEITYGPYVLASSTPLRFAARQVRVRFDQVNPTGWRIGTLRLGMQPSGRR